MSFKQGIIWMEKSHSQGEGYMNKKIEIWSTKFEEFFLYMVS